MLEVVCLPRLNQRPGLVNAPSPARRPSRSPAVLLASHPTVFSGGSELGVAGKARPGRCHARG